MKYIICFNILCCHKSQMFFHSSIRRFISPSIHLYVIRSLLNHIAAVTGRSMQNNLDKYDEKIIYIITLLVQAPSFY